MSKNKYKIYLNTVRYIVIVIRTIAVIVSTDRLHVLLKLSEFIFAGITLWKENFPDYTIVHPRFSNIRYLR